MAKAVKATVHRVLAEHPLHPERVRYYLERRDLQFEEKMANVLLVCQQVALQNEKRRPDHGPLPIVTVAVDEKPGLQAIANTSPDLPAVPGKHPETARDHEYKRQGIMAFSRQVKNLCVIPKFPAVLTWLILV